MASDIRENMLIYWKALLAIDGDERWIEAYCKEFNLSMAYPGVGKTEAEALVENMRIVANHALRLSVETP